MASRPTPWNQNADSFEDETQQITKQVWNEKKSELKNLEYQLRIRVLYRHKIFIFIFGIVTIGYIFYLIQSESPITVLSTHIQLLTVKLSSAISKATISTTRLLTVIIVIIITMFYFSLPSFSFSQLYFRPLDLKWKTMIAVSVSGADQLPRIVQLLRNYSDLTFYQHIDFGTEQVTLVISAQRRFIPYSPSDLRDILSGILKSTQVVFKYSSIPDIRFQRYHYLRTDLLYFDMKQFSRELQLNEVSGELMVAVSKNRDYVDDTSIRIETVFDVLIGFYSSNLNSWMSIINSVSANVMHMPYFSYLCNRYFPRFWRIWQNLLRFPGISKYVEIIASNQTYGRKAMNAIEFPRLDYHSTAIHSFSSPPFDTHYTYELGHLIRFGSEVKPIGIPVSDLAQGGIISGAIGTGKTTLRLHLMRMAIQHDIRVIDFDLKGDATRYGDLTSTGKVIIPNRNFHLNPFACPPGFEPREYSNTLLQSLVETIPAGNELSPPQLHLLTRAIHKTVKESGNARSFFKNLYILGHQEQQFIDNKQEHTAQAIITRFNWMQTVMHNIFWQSDSSLLATDYAETSLFFDLSQLDLTATRPQIRFLINLIMARITASMRDRRESKLSDMVFIDEAQILMPEGSDRGELTKLEQTVTTLRYKGVSVIAAGVSASLMSPVLLDVGFIAQFRSESTMLHRALALREDEIDDNLVSQLPSYHSLIKSNSIGSRPIMVLTNEFVGTEAIPDIRQANVVSLKSFDLDFDNIWGSRLDGLILPHIDLNTYQVTELRRIAMKFVSREYETYELKDEEILKALNQAKQKMTKKISSKLIDPIVGKYPQQFLLMVAYYYLSALIVNLRYETTLNLLEKNLESKVALLVRHVMNLTSNSQSRVFQDELVQLRSYISHIEEFQHLDREDINAATVEIAAQLEKLARILNIEEMGLAANIAELTAAGWLSPQQHALLNDFNRKVRNPVVHGTYIYKNTDLALLYRSAKLTLDLVEHYRNYDRDLGGDFDITPE